MLYSEGILPCFGKGVGVVVVVEVVVAAAMVVVVPVPVTLLPPPPLCWGAAAFNNHCGNVTTPLSNASLIKTTGLSACALVGKQPRQQSQSDANTALTRVPRMGDCPHASQCTPGCTTSKVEEEEGG